MFRNRKNIFFATFLGLFLVLSFLTASCKKIEKMSKENLYFRKKVALIVGNEMDLSLMMALIERYPNA
jgi:hypothetical protein